MCERYQDGLHEVPTFEPVDKINISRLVKELIVFGVPNSENG